MPSHIPETEEVVYLGIDLPNINLFVAADPAYKNLMSVPKVLEIKLYQKKPTLTKILKLYYEPKLLEKDNDKN
ncbi:15344_t:CDS:2 [Gigaspora margarita]|uniref:15344_t:CDS:1 n=1 Tax=Gigaspora margarita TaxID=4874 RepID=A0ABN7UPJ2_GIGMA|nr:15344_t:CDS:2 [Gigaspora margarita]